jgi:hypothetical protein
LAIIAALQGTGFGRQDKPKAAPLKADIKLWWEFFTHLLVSVCVVKLPLADMKKLHFQGRPEGDPKFLGCRKLDARKLTNSRFHGH